MSTKGILKVIIVVFISMITSEIKVAELRSEEIKNEKSVNTCLDKLTSRRGEIKTAIININIDSSKKNNNCSINLVIKGDKSRFQRKDSNFDYLIINNGKDEYVLVKSKEDKKKVSRTIKPSKDGFDYISNILGIPEEDKREYNEFEEVKLHGKGCFLLKSLRQKLWIDRNTYAVRQIEDYDVYGNRSKLVQYKNYKRVNGIEIPKLMLTERYNNNKIIEKSKSTIDVISVNEKVSDGEFSIPKNLQKNDELATMNDSNTTSSGDQAHTVHEGTLQPEIGTRD